MDSNIEAMGYYYQAERNIPYYPWVDKNGNFVSYNSRRPGGIGNPLTEIEGAQVYPVVLDRKGQRVYASFSREQSYWNKFIVELDDIYSDLENGKSVEYSLHWNLNVNKKRIWDNHSTQPTPPGWRMPTSEEFLSIMPSTPHAGNITFLRNLIKGTGGGNIGSPTGGGILDSDVIYIHVPNDKNNQNYPSDSYYDADSSPSGSVVKMGYDPAPGYSSEYVISKRDRVRDKVSKPKKQVYAGGDAEWGTIYGIKKVGTSEAYRMRWHIESRSASKNYYVLVVSRYSATSTDRLTYSDKNAANYYLKYDWSHPVATLYIPIVGMIGDRNWSEGCIGNFGIETILATSDRGSDNKSYVTFRIKIGGGGRYNQFIHLSSDRDGSGSQIRCVRDYTTSKNK